MKHELLPLAAPRQSGRSGGGGSEGTRRGSSKKKTFSDKAGAAFEVCVDKCVDLCGSGMYWVGPVFVFTGLAIITFAMYVGFGILLPAKDTSWSWTWVRFRAKSVACMPISMSQARLAVHSIRLQLTCATVLFVIRGVVPARLGRSFVEYLGPS